MKKIFCFLTVLFALAACVDDKGNYDYTDINEVEVVLPELYRRVYQEDQVVRVEPELTQTMADNMENLEFSWKYSTMSYGQARNQEEPVSTDPWVDLEIHEDDRVFNHYFWLEILDKTTGITYPFTTRVQVVSPFVNTWAILHDGDGSGTTAKLGAVEYAIGNKPFTHTDLFAEFGYPALTGAPVALGEDNQEKSELDDFYYAGTQYNVLMLMTSNGAESGLYYPTTKFEPYLNGMFIPQMVAPDYGASGFDPALTTYVHKPHSGFGGGSIVNDGKLYNWSGQGMKIYAAKQDPEVAGTVEVTHAVRLGRVTVLFDNAGKRFLYYENALNPLGNAKVSVAYNEATDNKAAMKLMDRTANNQLALDNITHEVLYMGALPRQVATMAPSIKSFAVANDGAGKSYIYLFSRTDDINNSGRASVLEIREVDTPAGMDNTSKFASGTAYNNMMFFSAGSKVYRYDFSTGVATLIYDHSAAGGGTVSAMRIAKQEPPTSTGIVFDTEAYGHDSGRSLGVAFNRGSTGEFVTLNLDEAGVRVIDSEVYTGFGLIKDIAFLAGVKTN